MVSTALPMGFLPVQRGAFDLDKQVDSRAQWQKYMITIQEDRRSRFELSKQRPFWLDPPRRTRCGADEQIEEGNK
jgi:hypothetical protein